MVLFPEGTDFTPGTKIRSDRFAEKNDLPKYDYVLHPRTTGFTYLVEQMRNSKSTICFQYAYFRDFLCISSLYLVYRQFVGCRVRHQLSVSHNIRCRGS